MKSYDEIVTTCKTHWQDCHEGEAVKVKNMAMLSSFDIGDIYKLSQEQARALLVGSSYLLAYRGMNVVITEDQVKLWDAIGKHLLDPPSLYFKETFDKPFEMTYFRNLFVTTIKTETGAWQLAQTNQLPKWKWFDATSEYPFSVRATRPGEYFVFPLFEAVLKKALSDYIDMSGKVIKEFRHYVPGDNSRSKSHCSNIGHLVTCLVNRSENETLKKDLTSILELIECLYPDRENASDVIANDWRNPALHGDENVSTSSVVILNLALLIAVHSCTEEEWEARFEV
ncbi:hypothetical protein [Vibrio diabolicus]|uniref:hypothetical protein n=1 Tax=Vibrio diabolicus TaxID=50719 RepID=UPI00375372D7